MPRRKQFRRYVFHVGRWSIAVGRWVLYANIGLFLLLVALFFLARIWLPTLESKKSEIETFLTNRTTYNFKIERLLTYWDGVYPGVIMYGLRLEDKTDSSEVLNFKEVRAGLVLMPLLRGSLQIGKVTILKPELELERNREGEFRVRGIGSSDGNGKRSSVQAYQLLSRLNEVVIQDGTVWWSDANEIGRKLKITNVNMALSSSARQYKLSIGAKFPENICLSCYVSVEFDSKQMVRKRWDGQIYIHTVGLDTKKLPLVIREHLPEEFSGKFDVLLRSEIENNKLQSTQGYISASGLVVPISDRRISHIRDLRARVDWHRNGDSWNLKTEEVELSLKDEPWVIGQLDIKYEPDASNLFIQHVDLDKLAAFLNNFKMESSAIEYIMKLQPRGDLDDVSLVIKGPLNEPSDFLLQTRLSSLVIQPYQRFPGIDGLTGKLSLSRNNGRLDIDANILQFTMSHVFRSPLIARRVAGSVFMKRKEEAWEIDTSEIEIYSNDINGSAWLKFTLPFNREHSPYINLKVNIKNANLENASRYYPINVLKPKLLSWLDNGIVEGRAVSGRVVIEGKTWEFPFVNNNGVFDVMVNIEDGVLDYLPGFPPLVEADILMQFHGAGMNITCREGKLGGFDVSRLAVTSEDLAQNTGTVLDISGQLFGSVDTALNVLRDSRFGDNEPVWVRYISPDISGEGAGAVGLDLVFKPKEAKETVVEGEYRFHGGALIFPVANLTATGLTGGIEFDNKGIESGLIKGKMLGGESVLEISRHPLPDKNKEVLAEVKGRYTDSGLAEAFGDWLVPYVFGQGTWKATMLWNNDRQNLKLVADTSGIEVRLPDPLAKRSGKNAPLIAQTRISESDKHIVDIRFGQFATSVMYFKRELSHWSLWGTHLALADAKAGIPWSDDLEISAKSDYLDADAWLQALDRKRNSGSTGIPDFITRMSGKFKVIDVADRRFGKLDVNLLRKEEQWKGSLAGDNVRGKIDAYFGQSYNKFVLNLDHLEVPSEPTRDSGRQFNPDKLPDISVTARDFRYGEMNLGQLDFAGVPVSGGWKLSRMVLKKEESELFSQGEITRSNAGLNAEFEVLLDTSNVGKTLKAFALPEQVSGGSAKIRSSISWNRVPDLRIDNFKGNLKVSAENGQFVKIKQGAGRALGIIDPTAIARYLQLDLRPIFGKGYSFDRMKGDIKINKGDAYTHNVVIKGPSADMRVSGRVGYIAEDYDLIVGVNPGLTDKLAIASWGLGAPQIGVAMLLFKKMFKKQAKKAQQITYTIKGSWDEPVMTRMDVKSGAPSDELLTTEE